MNLTYMADATPQNALNRDR